VDSPRVQYLSQQFVERLCSSEGITDELLAEIERVIFEAHPYEERLGASSFRELLELRTSHGRDLRRFAQSEMVSLAEQIEAERVARDELPGLKKERSRLAGILAEDKRARGGLVVVGGEERARRLEALNGALVANRPRLMCSSGARSHLPTSRTPSGTSRLGAYQPFEQNWSATTRGLACRSLSGTTSTWDSVATLARSSTSA
jgi:hypothetical protein